ncbi:hypothetical protein [Enterococcus avium]|uniref:beta-sandwich lipoprotein n=1 Tax=Enterococcus avium TaxID=33945 RepID=UPI0023311F98|nr:hypothetical protein [Enterococcus avium]MDB1728598.1 hypothetical protein [Enterococcus avium]MDB1732705.1 hypothetical protein [Enterococcus avium]
MKKKVVLLIVMVFAVVSFAGCRESEKVSHNVSQEADNFNVIRRVAVINMRTDKVEFEVIGRISIDTQKSSKLVILVETKKGTYKKHIINMTEWNMYVVEDLYGARVNEYKYEVNYMPKSIVPFDVVQKE